MLSVVAILGCEGKERKQFHSFMILFIETKKIKTKI